MSRPSLIIGAEGVLVSDPFEHYWDLVGAAAEANPAEVRQAFTSELGLAYLSGSLSEAVLWRWIPRRFGVGDERLWRQAFLERLHPLLSLGMVCRFAEAGKVHLVSELRAEWLVPILRDEGILPFLSSAMVSSRVGYLRPDLYALPAVSGQVLVIDRDERAAAAAAALRYRSLHADPEFDWLATTVQWLARQGRKHWRGLFVPRSRRAGLLSALGA